MSKSVVRILLSVFLMPLAAIVYLVTLNSFGNSFHRYSSAISPAYIAGAVTWLFVAVYWIAVWRSSLGRIAFWPAGPLMGTAVAPLVGAMLGFVMPATDPDSDLRGFVVSASTPLVWLITTVYCWAENDGERGTREAVVAAAGQAVCPGCGYDLRGQRELRCPECGAQFTVGQLLDGQPGRAAAKQLGA